MSSRNFFASILMACILTVGSGGLAPVANAAGVGQSFLNRGESARLPGWLAKQGSRVTP